MKSSDRYVLNALIRTLLDGEKGFRTAAEATTDRHLNAILFKYADQRAVFAGELQSLERSLGADHPPETGSAAGALHRGWINLTSAVSNHDDHAILEEAERGEDCAVEEYHRALSQSDLSARILDTLARQLTEVQTAHDEIRNLRDARFAQS